MKYPKARATVECCFLKESSTLQTGKHHLLRNLKQCITMGVRRRYIITRQHLFKDLVHFLYT